VALSEGRGGVTAFPLPRFPASPLPRFPASPLPRYFFAFAQASTVRMESAGT
jgi:hypothetical protein